MYYTTAQIVKKADRLVRQYGTRDPYELANCLGIEIIYRDFHRQRGVYTVILKNRFVLLKRDMHPAMEKIVLWHELGHDALHREEAASAGSFSEVNIFDMRGNRLEYEANIFASQLALPDEDVLELIPDGLDIQQIASALNSDTNLVALKVDTLRAMGKPFRSQEHRSDFLKY